MQSIPGPSSARLPDIYQRNQQPQPPLSARQHEHVSMAPAKVYSGREGGLGLGRGINSADAGSLYSVKAPPLLAKIDRRYANNKKKAHTTMASGGGGGTAGLPGSSSSCSASASTNPQQPQSHHQGHARFMAVQDLSGDVHMEGLSIISSNTSVSSLMSEDDTYLREVFGSFVQKVQEEQNNDAYEEGSSGSGPTTKGGGRTGGKQKKNKSTRDALSVPKGNNKTTGHSHRLSITTTSNENVSIPEGGLELIVPEEEAQLPYRLIPWRCVFQTWVRRLTDELLNQHSMAYLISIELFVRRSKDACNKSTDTIAATLRSPATGGASTSPKRHRTALGGVGARSTDPMIAYSNQLPHPLSLASCLYVFDVYLIPLLGDYAPTARRALHELVLATFMDPPPTTNLGGLILAGGAPGAKRTDTTSGGGSATAQQQPLLLSNHDESTAYLRPTYIQRFHELKHIYLVLRESNRRSNIVMERQDNILTRSLLKMQKQTAKRLVVAWHTYTQRLIRLRTRYRKVFLGLSDSATIKVSVKVWQGAARHLKAKQRDRRNNALLAGGKSSAIADELLIDPAMKERTRQMKMRHELTALIKQKALKANVLEEGVAANRRLQEKRSEFAEKLKVAKDRHRKISSTWAAVVEDLVPLPSTTKPKKPFDQFQGTYIQRTCFDDSATMEAELFHWIVDLSRRDDSISGRKLLNMLTASAQGVGGNPNQISHVSGVLSRVTYLLPILRAALTILSPPSNFVQLSQSEKLLPGFGSSTTSVSPSASTKFVAFGDVGTSGADGPADGPVSPILGAAEGSMSMMSNEPELADSGSEGDDDLAQTLRVLVPELSMNQKSDGRESTPAAGDDDTEATESAPLLAASTLATKHAKISVAIQQHLMGGREDEDDQHSSGTGEGEEGHRSSFEKIKNISFNASMVGDEDPSPLPIGHSVNRRLSDSIGTASGSHSSHPHGGSGSKDLGASMSMSRRRSYATAADDTLDDESEQKAKFLLLKRGSMKGASSTIAQSFTNKAMAVGEGSAASVDIYVERKKQLELILKPMTDIYDATGFSGFLLSLLQRLTKSSGVTFTKLLPSNYVHRLSRQVDDWRNLMLGYLYMSQFGNNSGCFRLLPTTGSPQLNATSIRHSSGFASSQRSEGRSGSIAGTNFGSLARLSKRGTQISLEAERPQFNQASEMKATWDERTRKRTFNGDDELAVMATRVHEMYMSNLVDAALSGGEVLREAERVYKLYSSACPTIANNTVITAEFMAAKLKVIFPPDKTQWRQANVNRRITSAKEMEEYLRTMSAATRVSFMDLCDRLVAAADDADHFFATMGTKEVQEAFEAHLADLSVVFSLYSTGTPPHHFIAREGWMQLTQPFLDTNFTSVVSQETFDKVIARNKEVGGSGAGSRRPPNPGGAASVNPALSVLDGASGSVGGAKSGVGHPIASLAVSSMGLSTVGGGGGGWSGSGAPTELLSGLNMDSFCQALCVLVAFKMANPFTPLDAKIPLFINNWLVPMAGTKVKSLKGAAPDHQARHTESVSFVPMVQ